MSAGNKGGMVYPIRPFWHLAVPRRSEGNRNIPPMRLHVRGGFRSYSPPQLLPEIGSKGRSKQESVSEPCDQRKDREFFLGPLKEDRTFLRCLCAPK